VVALKDARDIGQSIFHDWHNREDLKVWPGEPLLFGQKKRLKSKVKGKGTKFGRHLLGRGKKRSPGERGRPLWHRGVHWEGEEQYVQA